MYWILTERKLSAADFEAAMKLLFPGFSFLYYDVENDANNDLNSIFVGDGKQITYSIIEWSEKIGTKIEVWDFAEPYSIERTQYIGQFLSKHYRTRVVTELVGDKTTSPYDALLIDGDNLTIIDDIGIELDTYDYKIWADFKGQIQIFDENACLSTTG
jgi:hypothetical protein